MKIKADFITNSSSSAFYFIFKGGELDNLLKAIMSTGEHFKVSGVHFPYETAYTCDASDVVEEIEHLLTTEFPSYRSCYDEPTTIQPIDDLIADFTKDIEDVKRLNESYMDAYAQAIKHQRTQVEQAKANGFTHFVCAYFGDNEGDVTGNVGQVLDSNHCELKLTSDNLVIVTRSNH